MKRIFWRGALTPTSPPVNLILLLLLLKQQKLYNISADILKRIFMKWTFVKYIIFSILFLFSNGIFAADTYTLDPMHTYVLWHINHFGFSNPSGKWLAEGTLVLDEEKPQNSKVNVNIQTANFITGIPELDKHLKGPLFFDVARFPTATFVSNQIEVKDKKTALVHGILTVHGVSKPVTLDVTLNKMAMNPVSNKMSAGFSAITKIKRSDFGITTALPGLGDDVTLNIEAEANK